MTVVHLVWFVSFMHVFISTIVYLLENTQKTDWHRIVVFRPGLRDAVYNYLSKGQRVHVSGRIMYGELRDESGVTRTTTSIAADDIIFFNTNNNNNNNNN